ncbi:MAG: hypothetical protein E7D28_06700 [Clostridium sp.]|jgi:hypothetical protein|uniref:hypothetical protein n=1 Tax=Clostridium sp. TaxID=1506 RepID=UPI0029032A6F|nr:hypothetical protein [Clostridium sp.]MDU2459633.1 hypothetical protein [Clostridium sp.]
MALSEVKQKLCELYAFKDDLKLNHELIAVELGISTKSIQRYLKEPEVIQEINRICTSRLDRLIPTLTSNTESLLNSKSSADKVKGMDSYWKLQEKMDRIQAGTSISREQELIQKLAGVIIEGLKDILEPATLIRLTVEVVGDYVDKNKYQDKVSIDEIDRFLQEHVG